VKSIGERKHIEGLVSLGEIALAMAYCKIDEQEGKKHFERLFTRAYESKDARRISSMIFNCAGFSVFLEDALHWAEKTENTLIINFFRFYDTYAYILAKNGKYAAAVDAQKKYIELAGQTGDEVWQRPEVIFIPNRQLAVYLLLANNKEGAGLFERLYDESKNDAYKMYELARVFSQFNIKLDEAQKWIEQAINLSENGEYKGTNRWRFYSNPGFIRALYAEILYKNGCIKNAIEELKIAENVALTPDNKRKYRRKIEEYILKQK